MPVFRWIIVTYVLVLLFVFIPRTLCRIGAEERGAPEDVRGFNIDCVAMAIGLVVTFISLFLGAITGG